MSIVLLYLCEGGARKLSEDMRGPLAKLQALCGMAYSQQQSKLVEQVPVHAQVTQTNSEKISTLIPHDNQCWLPGSATNTISCLIVHGIRADGYGQKQNIDRGISLYIYVYI